MAVTRDIVEAHWHPRRVMSRLMAMGVREDRALAIAHGRLSRVIHVAMALPGPAGP